MTWQEHGASYSHRHDHGYLTTFCHSCDGRHHAQTIVVMDYTMIMLG